VILCEIWCSHTRVAEDTRFLGVEPYRMLPIFRKLVVPLPLVLGLLNPTDEGTTILRNMGSCQLIWCNTPDELNCGCRCVLSYLAEGKKGKGKVIPLQAWCGPGVSRGIALLFHDRGTRRG